MLPERIEDYIQMLDAGETFALMNFGDGEWSWLLGKELTNCDGFTGSPSLTAELKNMVMYGAAPNLFYGTYKCGSIKPLYQEADQWVQEYGHDSIAWVYKELISNANCQGKLRPLFEHLNNRKTLMIGPSHFDHLRESFFSNPPDLMTVPLPLDFTEVRGTYLILVRKMIEMYNPAIVTFSAGPLSNYLIYNLFGEFPTVTMIDMGACFDPYCGVLSRSGYRKATNIEKMLNNYPKEK